MKTYKFKINNKEYSVEIKNADGNTLDMSVNGRSYTVETLQEKEDLQKPITSPKQSESRSELPPAAPQERPKQNNAGTGAVKSPLPGTVLDVFVSVGDSVTTGQKLVLLEAMKMENQIDADRGGIIKSVNVRKGDVIMEGDVLVTIE
ncbi:MAG: acetyl-CoA carboxylase biotin carboxyl carrier protein subunit [Bacteroidales bacterium]|nr:acetyl-CoA carboxylase biotin carboxyl carrier protein subunit [Bacteroidales bacterium]